MFKKIWNKILVISIFLSTVFVGGIEVSALDATRISLETNLQDEKTIDFTLTFKFTLDIDASNPVLTGDVIKLELPTNLVDMALVQYASTGLDEYFVYAKDSLTGIVTLTALKDVYEDTTIEIAIGGKPKDITGQAEILATYVPVSGSPFEIPTNEKLLKVAKKSWGGGTSWWAGIEVGVSATAPLPAGIIRNYLGYGDSDKQGLYLYSNPYHLYNFGYYPAGGGVANGKLTVEADAPILPESIQFTRNGVVIDIEDTSYTLTWESDKKFILTIGSDYELQFSMMFAVEAPDITSETNVNGHYKDWYAIDFNWAVNGKFFGTSFGGFVPSLQATDKTFYKGQYSSTDLLSGVTAFDIEDGDISHLVVVADNGGFDINTVGNYTVKYAITDSNSNKTEKIITAKVINHALSVDAHNSTIYTGSTWSAANNFDSATNKDGTSIPFSSISTSGSVNTAVTGSYTITYTNDDTVNKIKVSKTITVTVLADQTTVVAKNVSIYEGGTWTKALGFTSATDKNGNALTVNDMTMGGDTVDVNTPGTYNVSYSYNNAAGVAVTATSVVTVLADQTTVVVQDMSIYVGDSWTKANSFTSATDKDGNALTVNDMTMGGDTVDVNTPGTYNVSYSYDNAIGTPVTSIAKVIVVDNKTSVNAKDSSLYVGQSWNVESDNFLSATDITGAAVPFSGITVTGTVDTTTVGEYTIIFTNGIASKTVKVTVLADQTTVVASPVTLYENQIWTSALGFVGATDKDGNALAVSDMTISGDVVDTTTLGVYNVTYTRNNAAGVPVIATSLVTILPDQTEIILKDVVITVGEGWNPENNFVSAKDKDGNAVLYTAFTMYSVTAVVTNNVDVTKAGEYQVTFKYEDHGTGFITTAIAKVSVINRPVPAAPTVINTGIADGVLPWALLLIAAAGTVTFGLRKKGREEN